MFSRYRRTPPSSANGLNRRRNSKKHSNQDPVSALAELRSALNRLDELTEKIKFPSDTAYYDTLPTLDSSIGRSVHKWYCVITSRLSCMHWRHGIFFTIEYHLRNALWGIILVVRMTSMHLERLLGYHSYRMWCVICFIVLGNNDIIEIVIENLSVVNYCLSYRSMQRSLKLTRTIHSSPSEIYFEMINVLHPS